MALLLVTGKKREILESSLEREGKYDEGFKSTVVEQHSISYIFGLMSLHQLFESI